MDEIKNTINMFYGVTGFMGYDKTFGKYVIDNVKFNPPATIVFWKDGSKTVVKCKEDETFDYEKGLSMAICKKLYGDDFHKTFRKWVPKSKEENSDGSLDPFISLCVNKRLAEGLARAINELEKSMKKISGKGEQL